MTIAPATLSPASSERPAPLVFRILQAFRLKGAVRNNVALLLLAELTGLGVSWQTIRSWSKIGGLLATCATSLSIAGDGKRAVHFARLASQAHQLWETGLADLCERSGRKTAVVIEVA